METRDSLFAGNDPFAIFRRWMDEAAATEPADPNAVALASVDESGLPNVRVVLLKEIEADGFVFYTNYDSAKGRELSARPQAAFVAHWKSLGRQVRARGAVERVASEQSDAYFASRPLDSRIGAWASHQSAPLASRDTLVATVERLRGELGDAPPRPPHWGGFRLTPLEIEFWADAPFRLHDRFRWRRDRPSADWTVKRLYP